MSISDKQEEAEFMKAKQELSPKNNQDDPFALSLSADRRHFQSLYDQVNHR